MTHTLRSAEPADILGVVSVHLSSFQGFFLTFLGPRFLTELYSAIQEDPSGIALVTQSEKGSLSGFVFGTTQPTGLYRHLLKRRWWRFGWAALPAFLRSPSILRRLIRAFSMPGQELPAEHCGTLMSIAVDPNAQGQGIGKALVRAFLREAKKRGLQTVNLTTDAVNNDSTNAFYRSQGFVLHQTYSTPEGRPMNEYLFRLAELDETPA